MDAWIKCALQLKVEPFKILCESLNPYFVCSFDSSVAYMKLSWTWLPASIIQCIHQIGMNIVHSMCDNIYLHCTLLAAVPQKLDQYKDGNNHQ